MSNLKIKGIQVGTSGFIQDNYFFYQPVVPDGTIRISNGNIGSSSDVIIINNDGNLSVLNELTSESINSESATFTSLESNSIDVFNADIVNLSVSNIDANEINDKDSEDLVFSSSYSVTNERIVVFDGQTGKLVKEGSLTISEIIAQAVPSGVISMWSGSLGSIPEGWALCNGNNGTPDLRDKFIVGAGSSYAVDDQGGEDFHPLSVNELPSHTHNQGTFSADPSGSHSHSGNTNATGSHSHNVSGNTNSAGSHSHTGSTSSANSHSHLHFLYNFAGSGGTLRSAGSYGDYMGATNTDFSGFHSHNLSINNSGDHSHNISANTNNSGYHSHNVSTSSSGEHSHTISGVSGSSGGGSSHENRPPYYALAYIMKL